MAHKTLQELFDKKMNRKEFLAHVGAGALIITGFSGILKTLLDYRPHKHVVSGYGSSAYGGGQRKKLS